MKIFNHLFPLEKSELRKNIAILIGGNGLAQIVTLLLYPFIARLYHPSAFGQLAVLFSIHGLITTAASGRYELAIVLPADDKSASALVSIGIRIAMIVSALITPVLLITAHTGNFFHYSLNINAWYYLLTVTVFMAAYAQLLNGWCTRFKFFKVLVGASLVLNISTAFFKLGLGLLHVGDGLLYSFVIAQVLMTVYLVVALGRKKAGPNIQPGNREIFPVARKYINFPRYTLALALLNSISTNLPVYMLAIWFNDNLTGQFSVAFSLLFKPIILYNGSVYQVLMQKVVEMQHAGEKVWKFISSFVLKTAVIAVAGGLILFVTLPYIVRIYLGNNWEVTVSLCRVMIPWAILSVLGGPLAFVPNMFNKQFKSLAIDFVYLVLRAGALAAGIYMKNVNYAIGLFATAGVVIIFYQLMWYRQLLRQADRNEIVMS